MIKVPLHSCVIAPPCIVRHRLKGQCSRSQRGLTSLLWSRSNTDSFNSQCLFMGPLQSGKCQRLSNSTLFVTQALCTRFQANSVKFIYYWELPGPEVRSFRVHWELARPTPHLIYNLYFLNSAQSAQSRHLRHPNALSVSLVGLLSARLWRWTYRGICPVRPAALCFHSPSLLPASVTQSQNVVCKVNFLPQHWD